MSSVYLFTKNKLFLFYYRSASNF